MASSSFNLTPSFDLTSLNSLSNNPWLPKKLLSSLVKGQKYQISSLKMVNTKFGQKVVITIDAEYDIFMPAKVSEALLEHKNLWNEMIEKAKNKCLFIISSGDSKFEFGYNPCSIV